MLALGEMLLSTENSLAVKSCSINERGIKVITLTKRVKKSAGVYTKKHTTIIFEVEKQALIEY